MRKKLALFIMALMMTLTSFACHESYLTLISGPTSIGGGQYSTTVQVCIGQTVNWGGTQNFTLTLAGANYVSFLPATTSNTYNAYTGASCGGPNCFMNTCAPVSATATGAMAGNVVTYNTTSSTPAGFPLVPDDNEECGGNPTSYCFNFTFVSDAYPTSISLDGNVEQHRPAICQQVCGFPSTYPGGPCNGSYDAAMTITFAVLPIELLYFEGKADDRYNLLEWSSATEINNDYYTIEQSSDGINWADLTTISGAGNSSQQLYYSYRHYNPARIINYYRLKQTDYDGKYEYFTAIAINNEPEAPAVLEKILNLMGQEVTEDYEGLKLYIYSDGHTEKRF